jgi:hypothetical protein
VSTVPEQYNATKMSVAALLAGNDFVSIEVPDWQRSYSWDRAEHDLFWTDLIQFAGAYPTAEAIAEQEYFLGSVVLVVGAGPALLLDGQQRLSTATILLSSLRDAIANVNPDAAVRLQERYIARFDDALQETTYALELSKFDREFFRREIQEPRTNDWSAPAPSLASHRLIAKARKYFDGVIEQKRAELDSDADFVQWCHWIRQVLTDHMSVIAVTSKDEDNAAGVFETLNDRGVGLSTPDLLRNLLLRRVTDAQRDSVMANWEEVQALSEYGPRRIEDFIRHFWISRHGDPKAKALYRIIRRSIEQTNTSSLDFASQLAADADVYEGILSGNDADADFQDLLVTARDVRALLLYPLILSAKAALSVTDQKRVLSSAINLFVRHTLIGQREGTLLEAVVYAVAVQLRSKPDADAACKQLEEFAPNDEAFTNAFATVRLTRIYQAAYVLRALEEYRRADDHEVQTPAKVNVEHIFPRTPDDSWSEWPDDAKNYVDRLGNLTLLAHRPNKSIRNGSFATKKEKAYKQSKLVLTSDLLHYEDWTPAQIEKRQQDLAADALKVWPLTVSSGRP